MGQKIGGWGEGGGGWGEGGTKVICERDNGQQGTPVP